MSTGRPLEIGMIKMTCQTAQLGIHVPNAWLMHYLEDVPRLVARVEQLEKELREIRSRISVP